MSCISHMTSIFMTIWAAPSKMGSCCFTVCSDDTLVSKTITWKVGSIGAVKVMALVPRSYLNDILDWMMWGECSIINLYGINKYPFCFTAWELQGQPFYETTTPSQMGPSLVRMTWWWCDETPPCCFSLTAAPPTGFSTAGWVRLWVRSEGARLGGKGQLTARNPPFVHVLVCVCLAEKGLNREVLNVEHI